MDCRKLIYYQSVGLQIINFNKELTPTKSEKNGRSAYFFGFNGQVMDNEVSGTGNTNAAMFWEYDTRLGRRWNRYPLTSKYPWQSPYACFNNNPIYCSDPSGLEGEDPVKKGDTFTGDDGKTYTASCDAVIINGRTSTNNKTENDVVASGQSQVSDYVSGSASLPINYALASNSNFKGSGALQILDVALSLSNAIQNGQKISPFDIAGAMITGSGLLLNEINKQMDQQIFEMDQFIATKGWDKMKRFADRYNTESSIGVIFVYSAQNVHEGAFYNNLTTIAFESATEAENAHGFKPTVVYYNFIEDINDFKVPTFRKLTIK